MLALTFERKPLMVVLCFVAIPGKKGVGVDMYESMNVVIHSTSRIVLIDLNFAMFYLLDPLGRW